MSDHIEALPAQVSPRRPALMVIGMHRTGSSAMTRVLSLAGAALPTRVLEASDGNPTGHWEPVHVIELDDALLNSLGSDWCDPMSHALLGGAAAIAPGWLDRAAQVLADNYGGAPMIVVKDPRASLLMRFWARALVYAGYDPCVVVMVRDPLAVARSLERRDAFPHSQSVLLWSSYMLAAERDTRDLRRVFVGYDDLLEDWSGVLNRIDISLDLGLAAPAQTARAEIDSFLDRELRHFHQSRDLTRPRIWPVAEGMHDWLAAAARDELRPPAAMEQADAELRTLIEVAGGALLNLRRNWHDTRAQLWAALAREEALKQQVQALQACLGAGTMAPADALPLGAGRATG